MTKRVLGNEGFGDKLINSGEILIDSTIEASKNLYADNETKLINKLKNLSKNNDKFFNDSIRQLEEQILDGTTPTERLLLEKQTKDLSKINILYKVYLSEKMTTSTNSKLNLFFNQVKSEIVNQNRIDDEKEEIERIINEENKKKEDNLIFNTSYRDLIEKSLDMTSGGLMPQLESINETDSIKKFYELFTIEYINLIENREGKIDKNPRSRVGLYLNEDELNKIILKIIIELELTDEANEFDYNKIEFTLIKNDKKKLVNLSIKESIEKERLKIELIKGFKELSKLFKGPKDNFKGMYSSNSNKLSNTGERMIQSLRGKTELFNNKELYELLSSDENFLYVPFLEVFGFGEETKKTINYTLDNFSKDETITIGGKKIKFTPEFIKRNKEKFIDNLKTFFSYLMIMETSGGRINVESISGAKGVVQFLDGYKGGKKIKKGQWSFQTALNRAKSFWKGNIPQYIKEANEWGGKFHIDKFSPDKQLALWIPDAIMRKKDNYKAQRLLMGIMLGNTWSAKTYYQEIHNTEKKKNVSKLVEEKTNDVFKRFIQIKNQN